MDAEKTEWTETKLTYTRLPFGVAAGVAAELWLVIQTLRLVRCEPAEMILSAMMEQDMAQLRKWYVPCDGREIKIEEHQNVMGIQSGREAHVVGLRV